MIDIDKARPILEGIFDSHAAIKDLGPIAWGLVADADLAISRDEHSVYRIASMTKSFSCAAILKLRDEGIIRLDDPISVYAPELAHICGPTTDSPQITVRHLMTMSAGLATDDAWADRHLDVADPTLDTWMSPGLLSAYAPGTAFEYSNLGFGLLGRVVLRASGTRIQDVVSERLLKPLGMHQTSWTPPDGVKPGRRNDDAEATETLLGDGAIAPMGGIFTTVSDLAKWVAFMADAFPARNDVDDACLSRASRREMQQVHRGFDPREFYGVDGRDRYVTGGYGFGLNVTHHDRLGWVVGHSGGLPGFGSNMRWVPSLGIGLVALANRTYAPMVEATSAALDALVSNGVISRAIVPVSDAVTQCAALLVELHNSWTSETASETFSDNVDSDLEYSKRAEVAGKTATEHGPFKLARIEADSATSATVVAHGDGVELSIFFEVSPLKPPRVQRYETTIMGADC